MKLEHMRLFMDVVETGSVSSAAEKSFISQQGLSVALKQMEKELHRELFTRGNRKLTLTETGQAFYHCCEKMLLLYDDFLTQTGELTTNNTFDLYITPNMANYFPLINEAPFAKKNGFYFNYLEQTIENVLTTITQRPGIAIISIFTEKQKELLSHVSPSLSVYEIGQENNFLIVCHKDSPIVQLPAARREEMFPLMKCVMAVSPKYDLMQKTESKNKTICLPNLSSCFEFLKTQDAYTVLSSQIFNTYFDNNEFVILADRKLSSPIEYYIIFNLKKDKNTTLLEQQLTDYLQTLLKEEKLQ